MMMTMMMEEWTLLRMRIDYDDDGDDGTRNIHTKARKEKKKYVPDRKQITFSLKPRIQVERAQHLAEVAHQEDALLQAEG